MIDDNHRKAALECLAYFDVFNHPLSARELLKFCADGEVTEAQLLTSLNQLVAEQVVFYHDGHFALKPAEQLVRRKSEGALAAAKALPKAISVGRFIGRFPFVCGVGISGSLSKGYFDSESDFDFFIITSPGRLWLARTLLIAFKKLFLANSRKYFCVNYFIDTDHLLIPDQNLYTATELVTLVPAYNQPLFNEFFRQNSWARGFLPNAYPLSSAGSVTQCPPSSLLEKLLPNALSNWLDVRFQRLTMRRWKKKFGTMGVDDFEIAMRSRRYVSKHHPHHFQAKVLAAMAVALQKINQPVSQS